MYNERIEALIEAAKACGIAVERAPLGGEGGGMAVIAGRRKLYIDTNADAATVYDMTVTALAGIEELIVENLPQSVRDDLETARKK